MRPPWKKGDCVYWRHRDLFGSCVEDETAEGKVLVKLEWPWDLNAPPELADANALVYAYEVDEVS